MRLLSLLPAATDIVTALGEADRLVGITHECDAPPSLAPLPRVTQSAVDGSAAPGEVDRAVREVDAGGEPLFMLDEQHIAALSPDLILTQGICEVCAVSEGDVRALAARLTPTPHILTLSAATLDDVFNDIISVGEAIHVGERAAALVAELRARMQYVHEILAAARAPRPRVAVIEWTDPLYSAGHWVPRMVRRAGGYDVLATEGERSHPITFADLAAAAPEVVVVAPCGYSAERAAVEGRALLAQPEWASVPATRVWALDGNALLSRPGPQLVDGIEAFAALLHPTLFPSPANERAIMLAC